MNLSELIHAAGAIDGWDAKSDKDIDIKGLSLDSRTIEPGFLFAALPGETVHGKDFVTKAVALGAVAILSDQPLTGLDIPVLVTADPHRALAKMAKTFYPQQPENLLAVTGTNGKSSVVEFLRQIWQDVGRDAAAIGTLGITTQDDRAALGYTTPDCIRLHQVLQELAVSGVQDCAIEASSHGLVQRRLDGAKFTAAGFTNLTQDHFDYHEGFEDYFAAKQRLFLELLPEQAPVVVNVDDAFGASLAKKCQRAGLDVWRIGWSGEQIKLLEIQPELEGQQLQIRVQGTEFSVALPLVGEFQAANALLALGLALRTGVAEQQAVAALSKLSGVRGRLELVALTADKVPVLVDFAHTPDGLQKLLQSVRAHTQNRIILVFGCGGDRDPKKRPLMGEIAKKYANLVVVTDDNPRTENPKLIRAAILNSLPNAREIADRKQAIQAAIEMSQTGDLIVVAGKGHEQGQIVGNTVFAFDDADAIRELVEQD
ncbi:UDP-N-acetylmuramoylalanyl-D-glutamate--2,6-diaminopimelate ligase [hydrothermal vent metagenome]|uniref:UDP-N-acetylmuramoylalanyl-D-glutamate--2,6-diaminopimelate ligase n=1 Tax=hydrothermal vent metagenome TaxID=652676 RepID=A0A3B0RVF5_9ZZZZ